MSFLQNNFLTNIFIMIEQEKEYCFVHVHKVVNSITKRKEKKKFFFESKTKTPEVMIDYIYSFSRKYSSTYVSIVIDSDLQNTLIEDDLDKKTIKEIEENNTSIYVSDKWRIYCNIHDLNIITKDFKTIRLDFILSPLAMLYFLYNQYSRGENSIYILTTARFLSIMIFKNSIAVASSNISLVSQIEETPSKISNHINDIDTLEDEFDMTIDNDIELEMDMELQEDENKTSTSNDIKEVLNTTDENNTQSSLVQDISEQISKTVDTFYNSSYYRGDQDFIENIVLFNSSLMDAKLKTELKDSLMMEIYSRDIILSDVMSDMNKSMIWNN